jgi:threonine/homoserine/homoserine lactone efflux protein
VLFTVATGIAQGRQASLWATLGCTLGILPHLLATVLGLAAVLHTSAMAFQLLKIAGVVYLLYIAFLTWKDKAAFAIDEAAPKASASRLVVRAMLLNVLNPKLTIFFLAFLPQFVGAESTAPLQQLLILSGVFMGMTFAVFAVYGLMAHAFRTVVIESSTVQNWLRRSFATAFAALGAHLALSEQ